MTKPRLSHDGQQLPGGIKERQLKNGQYRYKAIAYANGTYKSLGTFKSLEAAKQSRDAYIKAVTKGKKRKRWRTDLTNQSFGHAVAIEATSRKATDGSILWTMLCDCGQYFLASTNALLTGRIKSCGHIKKDIKAGMPTYYGAMEKFDTDSSFLQRKMASNNKSGYKNIAVSKTKKGELRYIAQIRVAKQTHYLGSFKDIRNAILAVNQAREEFVKPTIDKINRFKKDR